MSKSKYTVGAWHGRPNYICRFCAFSTLSEKAIKEHYVRQHVTPLPPSPILLTDKDGNEVGLTLDPMTDEKEETLCAES